MAYPNMALPINSRKFFFQLFNVGVYVMIKVSTALCEFICIKITQNDKYSYLCNQIYNFFHKFDLVLIIVKYYKLP